VSSGLVATVRGYGLGRRVPQGAKRKQAEPQGERAGREGDHDKARLVPGGIRRSRRNPGEHQGEDEKKRA
jgi:hypothetical protein